MSETVNCSHFETLGEVELYFEHVGPRNAPAVLFLHGGPGYNSYSFQDQMGEFLEPLQMVYLDQRGCGRSGPLEGDLTIDDLVEDAEAVRAFLDIDQIIPLGHGFGAIIALEYARRFPEHVPKVITINPWIHMSELAKTLLYHASQLSGLPFEDPADNPSSIGLARIERAFGQIGIQTLFNSLQFIDARSRLRLEFSDTESQLLGSSDVQASLVHQGLWEFNYAGYLLECIRPVSVIFGTHDQTSYPHQTDWLIDLVQAEPTELEAGHYPWVDDPDRLAEEIIRTVHKQDG